MKIAGPACLLILSAILVSVPPTAIAEAAASAKSNLDLARQLNQAFVQVAEDVSPAVVVITVTQKADPHSSALSDPGNDSDGDSDPADQLPPEFRRFFRFHQRETPEPTQGQGSGVIIRKDGYILTNRHVVESADKIEVRLRDGRTFKGQVRGVDAPADVAVVKIDADDLPVAKLADSAKTKVGEFAIAIGAPFALDYTVTFGHVSAKDRSNIYVDPDGPQMLDQEFIQTDANINPGNSGGPLVNIDGEVIGINTLIRGLHTGIGFAIPSNLAREIADQLIERGKFTRAWLGIGIASLREEPDFRSLVKNVQDGVVVRAIVADGPAAKSKLVPQDVITKVDGKPVVTSQQLKDEIRSKKVGADVNLDVVRDGKHINVVVNPGEWNESPDVAEAKPSTASDNVTAADLGITVKTLTKEMASQFDVDLTEGVIVTSVDRTGLAARRGIKPGDIITSVGQQHVADLKQFRSALRNCSVKKGVVLNLISEGSAKFEILKEGKD